MRKITCRNCGVRLWASRLLYIVFYSAIAAGAGAAGLSTTLEYVYGWPDYWTFVMFISIVVIFIPVEVLAWRHGHFHAEIEERTTEHGSERDDLKPTS